MKKKIFVIIGLIITFSIVAIAITIPLVLKKQKNNSLNLKQKAQANKDIANVEKLFKDFKNTDDMGIETIYPSKKTTLPSSLIKETTSEKIGFKDPSKDKRNNVDVSFKVINHNDTKGTLKVQVAFSKKHGDDKIIDFTLKGYQTIEQAKKVANLLIEKVEKLFDYLKNNKDGTQNTFTNGQSFFPSLLIDEKTARDIGFIDPSRKSFKNKRNCVDVSFKVIHHDDIKGTLKVQVTLSKKHGNDKIINFILKGYKHLLPITQQNVNEIIQEFQEKDFTLALATKYYLKPNVKINWPKNLSYINWEGIKGLNIKNTPFQDDISSYDISYSILKGVDVSEVIRWPQDLRGIKWEGVKGLTKKNTPFQGDMSNYKLSESDLKSIDISQVTKWPEK